MKKQKHYVTMTAVTVAFAAQDALAHAVPGDLLSLHHGVTHQGIGITHIMLGASVIVLVMLAAKQFLFRR